MLFNTPGVPTEFMYYNNDIYYNGTEIALTDVYAKNHIYNGKPLWKYAYFNCKCNPNGVPSYMFIANKLDWSSLFNMGLPDNTRDNYAPYFTIPASELYMAIEEVTKPMKLTREQTDAVLEAIAKPKSDFDNPELIVAWVVYILAMLGSLIFNEFYLIWPIITLIFSKVRKEMIK